MSIAFKSEIQSEAILVGLGTVPNPTSHRALHDAMTHGVPNCLIGGFIQNCGSKLAGGPVEDILHEFIDYFESHDSE